MCALALALVAGLVATPPSPAASPRPYTPPPAEALEEYRGYERWPILAIEIGREGETAMIRLRHPDAGRVVAVLQYRLISSAAFEVPDGPRGVAPGAP